MKNACSSQLVSNRWAVNWERPEEPVILCLEGEHSKLFVTTSEARLGGRADPRGQGLGQRGWRHRGPFRSFSGHTPPS